MDKVNDNGKILMIAGGLLLIAAAAFAGIYFMFRAKPVEGGKSVTIQVVNDVNEVTRYELKTDAKYLRQAMEETEGLTFSGTEGSHGMMVDTVNGLKADYNVNMSYWGFNVNGTYCNYGIDSQPVMDGDIFSIEYIINTQR